MARNGYVGVSNKSKRISNLWVGVSNKPKKVLKAWVGDASGKPKQWYPPIVEDPILYDDLSSCFNLPNTTLLGTGLTNYKHNTVDICRLGSTGKYFVAYITNDGVLYGRVIEFSTTLTNGHYTMYIGKAKSLHNSSGIYALANKPNNGAYSVNVRVMAYSSTAVLVVTQGYTKKYACAVTISNRTITKHTNSTGDAMVGFQTGVTTPGTLVWRSSSVSCVVSVYNSTLYITKLNWNGSTLSTTTDTLSGFNFYHANDIVKCFYVGSILIIADKYYNISNSVYNLRVRSIYRGDTTNPALGSTTIVNVNSAYNILSIERLLTTQDGGQGDLSHKTFAVVTGNGQVYGFRVQSISPYSIAHYSTTSLNFTNSTSSTNDISQNCSDSNSNLYPIIAYVTANTDPHVVDLYFSQTTSNWSFTVTKGSILPVGKGCTSASYFTSLKVEEFSKNSVYRYVSAYCNGQSKLQIVVFSTSGTCDNIAYIYD